MRKENSQPAEVYVQIVYTSNMTRENMETYRQKAPGSDEFVCVEQDQMPIGQHMIEFLSESNARLPKLVSEFKKHFNFIQNHNFDHHLVPVHIEALYELFENIRSIHPWWSACFPMGKLWELMNNYSFYSIHPSPYLIETYDEVDRLMEEETCWRNIVDQLQVYIEWFEAYIRHLNSFEQALACCLDSDPSGPLSSLSGYHRAFIYRSFFDDLFLRRTGIRMSVSLQESYTSPLGSSISRATLFPQSDGSLRELVENNMDFNAIYYESSDPIKMDFLVSMVENKTPEIITSALMHEPGDIFSICANSFYMMLTSNIKIRKCKNCGEYFVPLNRSDELYCCRMQKNGKRCRELDYSDKIDTDVLLSIYRTAYKTHNARKQRSKKSDIQSEQKFREWVVFAKQLLSHAQSGELSVEEYSELIRK